MKKRKFKLPIVTIPFILFCDDLSGNVSKKWNKFVEWNMTIAGMLLHKITIVDRLFPTRTSSK